ncbi:MAG: hypothetical protein M3N93_09810 [Acidobacteriota bacterium]|nr:hypothetical protein [Acidobacteriota bacterium]
MTSPAYPLARKAARRVHPHYARHLADPESSLQPPLLPDVETVEAMIDAAFWASLRREEGFTPRVSLAFVHPSMLPLPLTFEKPVPLAAQPLTRLGPAVERPGIHLCVSRENDDLVVWGAARNLPRFCFVLEVVAPGLLILKHSRGDDSGKFVNVAVLEGEEVKVIDQHAARAYESDSPDTVNVTMQLAVSMRDHGRGGTLLMVPSLAGTWRESILHPIRYSVAPAFRGLVNLMNEDPGERSGLRWQEALRRAIAGIAGLTAVDGATIMTENYELVAFGAKIIRPRGRPNVGNVVITEPIEGAEPAVADPGRLGGTRHLSAAQFAHDQRDAIALVASQDGHFTFFAWSAHDQMVRASRVETLLL